MILLIIFTLSIKYNIKRNIVFIEDLNINIKILIDYDLFMM